MRRVGMRSVVGDDEEEDEEDYYEKDDVEHKDHK